MTKMVSSLEKNNDFSFSDKVNSSTSVINRSKNQKNSSEQQQQQQQQQQKPVPSNKRNDKEIQEPSNVHVLILFILFLLFVFFYTGLRVYLRPTKAPLPVAVNTFQEYLTEIQQIKYMYFTQTDEFWNILKDDAQQVLATGKEHKKTPAVMMIVLPDGEKQLAVCLVDYWSQIMNRLSGSKISDLALEPVVDGSSITSYKPGHQKSIISEQIQTLVASGYKSVIVSSWENLHIETLQLLCSICESTNSFYKQVTVIFLLEIPDEEHHIINKLDVHSYLSSIWSHLKSDQVKNLLTAIASNVAFLTPDDTFMGC